MVVFGVVQYRTDTSKPGSESLLHTCDEYGRVDEYCPLYADRKDAEEAAECLDIGQEGDPYSIIRYRVIELTVK
jgi:hypothetical protein